MPTKRATKNRSITIRGTKLTVADTEISDLEIMTFAAVFGDDMAPQDETSREYAEWKGRMLFRLRDPIVQASTAYSLTSMFPDIDRSVVDYQLTQVDGGYSTKAKLKLNLDELESVAALLTEISKDRNWNKQDAKAAAT